MNPNAAPTPNRLASTEPHPSEEMLLLGVLEMSLGCLPPDLWGALEDLCLALCRARPETLQPGSYERISAHLDALCRVVDWFDYRAPSLPGEAEARNVDAPPPIFRADDREEAKLAWFLTIVEESLSDAMLTAAETVCQYLCDHCIPRLRPESYRRAKSFSNTRFNEARRREIRAEQLNRKSVVV